MEVSKASITSNNPNNENKGDPKLEGDFSSPLTPRTAVIKDSSSTCVIAWLIEG